VIAKVCWPAFDALIEALRIPSEQGPRRFLKSGRIAGHDRHKAASRLLAPAHAILAGIGAARLLDELPEHDGGSFRLAAQPLPVARQQRDLPGDDPELRASRTTTSRFRLRAAGLERNAAEVHFDQPQFSNSLSKL